MDRATVEVYERRAAAYRDSREAYDGELAAAFRTGLPPDGVVLDLGCGPGLYLSYLGRPAVALDASVAMCAMAGEAAPAVCADQAALPFRPGAFAGVWAWKCLQHLAAAELPGALAELHRVLPVGGRLALQVFRPAAEVPAEDDFPGRLFTWWEPDPLRDLLDGAGFDIEALVPGERSIRATATRARTLPDVVGPNMRLLVCGLNPSVYAADAGVGYARPGNRFWPAALAAGLVTVDRDPWHALRHHGVGFTDLVKRTSPGAAELTKAELRAGAERLNHLCRLVRPAAVALCGLTGWRAAVDPKATLGWQDRRLGGAPVYVLPNPSGRNAHVTQAQVAEHLRTAVLGVAVR